METSLNQLILLGSAVTALGAILYAIKKISNFFHKIEKALEDIVGIKKEHGADVQDLQAEMKELKSQHDGDIVDIRAEQALIIYGLLGALKAFRDNGHNNRTIEDAIDKIEKHLNREAHR